MECGNEVKQALGRLLRHVAPTDKLVDSGARQSQHLIARPRYCGEL